MDSRFGGFQPSIVFPVVLIGWIFSLCLHEFSHAAVAYRGGDHSVREKGYLSFNPLKYIDPTLSLVLPILFLIFGGIGLPGGSVLINQSRLKSPLWQSAVSLAGPLSNAVFTVLLALVFHSSPTLAGTSWGIALAFLLELQVCAVLFNLLPVPGLDGFGIIAPFLPKEMRDQARLFGRNGVMILFAVMWIPSINHAFWNIVDGVVSFMGINPYLADLGRVVFQFWR